MANEEYVNHSNFKVSIDGSQWQVYESVSGIGGKLEKVIFQGDKNHVHSRPGRYVPKPVRLVRRLKDNSELHAWWKDTCAGQPIRKSGSVIVLDDEEKEIVRFNFFGAWPEEWSIQPLSKNGIGTDILCEEMVLSVDHSEMA